MPEKPKEDPAPKSDQPILKEKLPEQKPPQPMGDKPPEKLPDLTESQRKLALKLVATLRSENAKTRIPIAQELAALGPAVVPLLLEHLKDEQPFVRSAVVFALGEIGMEARSAIPALVTALSDEDVLVRRVALGSLEKMGPEARSAAPAIVEALQSPEPSVRRSAAIALLWIEPAAKDVLPALVKALEDEDDIICARAAGTLSQLGPEAQPAIPALIGALNHKNKTVRKEAAVALGMIGPAASNAVPSLSIALEDRDGLVAVSAAVALVRISPQNEGARQTFTRLSRGTDFDKVQTAETLGNIGPRAGSLTPILITLLNDKSNNVRAAAALAVSRIGPGAKAAVPTLVNRARDTLHATEAIFKMGPESVPLLIQVLKIRDPILRSYAAAYLGRYRADAKSAVPLLLETVEDADEHPGVRANAAIALGQIGHDGKAVAPVLISLLNYKSETRFADVGPSDVRIAAAAGLRAFPAEARTALQTLRAMMKDSEPEARVAAASAVVVIEPGDKEAVKALVAALQDRPKPGKLAYKTKKAWLATASLIKSFGAESQEALAALVEALGDADEDVRTAAGEALIGVDSESGKSIPAILAITKTPEPKTKSPKVLADHKSIQLNAYVTLLRLDPDNGVALQFFRGALRTEGPDQFRTTEGVARVGPHARALIPFLVPLLRSKDTALREEAAKTLMAIGPAAKTAAAAVYRFRYDAADYPNQPTLTRVADDVWRILRP